AEKVTIEGYEIEKGSKLLANIWKLSRNKRFFSTPDQFNPEHFLDANGQFVKKEANAPFSLGKRRCMGAKLAEVELFISFVSLMQKFNWSPPIDEKIEFRVLEGFARVLKSYKVRANLRF
ncbi:cytochrome P450 2J2-like protein, partial [Dinothrombium tinctorium]